MGSIRHVGDWSRRRRRIAARADPAVVKLAVSSASEQGWRVLRARRSRRRRPWAVDRPWHRPRGLFRAGGASLQDVGFTATGVPRGAPTDECAALFVRPPSERGAAPRDSARAERDELRRLRHRFASSSTYAPITPELRSDHPAIVSARDVRWSNTRFGVIGALSKSRRIDGEAFEARRARPR